MGQFYFEDFFPIAILDHLGKTMKMINTEEIFLLNYKGFKNNRVNLYEFFFLGT
jgi:hypothetical protein